MIIGNLISTARQKTAESLLITYIVTYMYIIKYFQSNNPWVKT